MRFLFPLLVGFLLSAADLSADSFRCAGYSLRTGGEWIDGITAKPVRNTTRGSRRALVIFARFADGEDVPVPGTLLT